MPMPCALILCWSAIICADKNQQYGPQLNTVGLIAIINPPFFSFSMPEEFLQLRVIVESHLDRNVI